MIYFGGFRKISSGEKDEYANLDGGQGLYNKDGGNVSLVYAGTKVPVNAFKNSMVPKVVFGKKITFLSVSSFYNCSNLTQISLPNVTSIDAYSCYSCSNLTQVSLPNVTSIDKYVFYGCSNLTQVSLPNVTSIDKYVFYGCYKLKKITCKQSMRFRIQQSIQESGLTQPIEIIEV